MKNIFFLFNFIYFSISFAQQKTDWELWNLKNAPKEVTYIYRQALPDSLIDKKKINSYQQTFIFNKNGFITLQSDNFGVDIGIFKYEYDDFNRIIKGNYLNASKGYDRSIKAYYNNKGQKVRQEMYDGNKLTYQRNYYYDPKGNISKMEYFDEDYGISREKPYSVTYVYDKNGLKIEENIQNTTVVRYKYDKNGNSIREEYYDYASGKLNSINTLEYEYDNKNNWTKQTRFYNNSPSYYTLGLIKYSPSSEK